MNDDFTQLRNILAEVSDLERACRVLEWDQETYMPPGGAEARAWQCATLSKLRHEMFTSDEVGELLEKLEPAAATLDADSFEASLVRVTRRLYDQRVRVPAELEAEITRQSSLSMER